YRLHSENGHKLDPEVARLLTAGYSLYGRAADSRNFQRLSDLVGSGFSADLEIWSSGWRNLWMTVQVHLRIRGPSVFRLQVCPPCLMEYGCHFSLWELPMVKACPLHRCALQRCCPRCQGDFRWQALKPGWQCRCGLSLTTIDPPPATPFYAAVAEWIAAALDAPPFPPSCLPDSRFAASSITLRTGYRLLAELFELRSLLVDVVMRDQRLGTRQNWQASHARTQPHVWELGLARDWPNHLADRLQRLMRRRFRACLDGLLYLPPGAPIEQTLSALLSVRHEGASLPLLHEPLMQWLNQHRLPIPFAGWVLFHPRLEGADRALLLQRFRRWWHAVCLRVRSQVSPAEGLDQPAWLLNDAEREARSMAILNAALRLSELGSPIDLSAKVFGSLVAATLWQPLATAINTLCHVAAQLMSLPARVLDNLAADSLALIAQMEARTS
ncbi:MAG TPA: TniQ family protein, partial [Aquabacterium sp.]|nr:TniQ family protein [Aquabacterium sp.]